MARITAGALFREDAMKPGQHDFDGACVPVSGAAPQTMTFSVGCFAWTERAHGNGLKRGKVKVRVHGLVSDADAVYARAREVCNQLDNGAYVGPKTINLPSAASRVSA